uniref:Uncharacterized protein n=1 Tax=Panagrolaimus sp. JU765 TaxID=591449 RepID=A0AC34QYD8_9BILA
MGLKILNPFKAFRRRKPTKVECNVEVTSEAVPECSVPEAVPECPVSSTDAPVKLCCDLYADIFDAATKGPALQMTEIFKFMLIGQEAVYPVVQVLRKSISIEFYCQKIKLTLRKNAALWLDYGMFTSLIQLIIPYVTKIRLVECRCEKYYDMVFQTLSKNHRQKKLTIVDLWKITDSVIDVLQQLEKKNIPVILKYPTMDFLMVSPVIKIDTLKILFLENWLHLLVEKQFSCSFSKLIVSKMTELTIMSLSNEAVFDYIEELTIGIDFPVRPIFDKLNQCFPNVKKLTIHIRDKILLKFGTVEEQLDRIKNEMEEAPQKEIIINFNSARETTSKTHLLTLGFATINDTTLQWISEKNQSKMIIAPW